MAVPRVLLEPVALADALGRLLAHEEVAVAAHHLHEALVLAVVGEEELDAEEELVVAQGEPFRGGGGGGGRAGRPGRAS